VLHAAVPFSGEDFALFLNRMPGTFTFLGVPAPGADITTCYPHLGGLTPMSVSSASVSARWRAGSPSALSELCHREEVVA
jgi:hypothetical protein